MNTNTERFFIVVMFFLFGLFVGMWFAANIVVENWRDGCNKIGKHLSNDVVYVCHPEVKP